MEITADAMTLSAAMQKINGHHVISYEAEEPILYMRLLETGWYVVYAPFIFLDKKVIVQELSWL